MDAAPPATGPTERGPGTGWLALLCVLAGLAGTFRVFDFDAFWHTRTGRWIWEHRAVPLRDPFAHTSDGPLRYTEALAQLVFHLFDRVFGGFGLSLLGGALAGAFAAAVLLATARPERLRWESRAVAVACVFLASSFRFGPKTELISFSLWAVLTHLVSRHEEAAETSAPGVRDHARFLVAVAALSFLWGNCHRAGGLVPFGLGAVAVAWALRAATRPLAPVAVGALLVSVFALTLNSGGAYYFLSTFAVTTRATFAANFAQQRPVSWEFLVDVDPWVFPLVALFLLGALVRRRLDASLALAVTSLSLPFVSLRFIPFAAVGMAPFAARAVDALIDRGAAATRLRLPSIARGVVVLSAAALPMAAQQVARHAPSIVGLGVVRWRVPVGAADFLRQHPPVGRMWNSYDFGGYLMYALAPGQKVFVDGRYDTPYSQAFVEESILAQTDDSVLARQFERFGVTYAVIACSRLEETRYPWLLSSPEWGLVYFDDVAAVVVKRTKENAPLLAAHEYRAVSPRDAIRRASSLAGLTGEQRALFEQEVERAVRDAPDSIRAHVLRALVLRARGELEAAKREAETARALGRSRRVSVDLRL
ncbi:MAG: hypothetical protein HYV09_38605 [Deltaproteobacteria bacterium]|nr:hypothetical protein [Deltaproteobacteria bacterium]